MAFARLFESKEYGQLLVKRDANEDGVPEVRVYFEPEGLGVCSVAFEFSDSDQGFELAEKALELMTLERAELVVAEVLRKSEWDDPHP